MLGEHVGIFSSAVPHRYAASLIGRNDFIARHALFKQVFARTCNFPSHFPDLSRIYFSRDRPRFSREAKDIFFLRERYGIFYDNNRREGSHGKSRTGNEREIRR